MTDCKVTIYGVENLSQVPWPANQWSEYVRKFLSPFVLQGTRHFIDNIDATVKILHMDSIVMPIVICGSAQGNSYVCSPYCHFITYGKEMISKLRNTSLRTFLRGIIGFFGKALSYCEIDKIVYINNWFTPTNLYPSLTKKQIDSITAKLKEVYPDHALAFRSINTKFPGGLFEDIKAAGYKFILSRFIYVTDTKDELPFKSRMFKSDQKILHSSPYTPIKEINATSINRIQELYTNLNIDKYSHCNPQFNQNFVRLAFESQFLRFTCFEREGKIDAVYGFTALGEVMTSPFFGYDLSLPQETGLYRKLSAHLLLEARKNNMILHQSSGAGHYKKLRRADELEEYTAIYSDHLNFKRRLCWKVLQKSMSSIGKKFMDQME